MENLSIVRNMAVPRRPASKDATRSFEDYFYVLLDEKRQVGCVSVCSTFENLYILDVSISMAPAFQRAEVYIQVLKCLSTQFDRQGIRAYVVISRDGGLEVIKAYQKFGAMPCFERKGSLLSLDGKCIRWIFDKRLFEKIPDKTL